ncbi:MAG: 3-keto-5-aminohexanoate cleavage protein [Victivallales bacterium]|nr:3-keto-5-aminohexanoate cleavage protein [Victivallales bacterium]MCF7889068.1 3-keto-5-aminohexanoate cleavage protein [Victivallales bacterium]
MKKMVITVAVCGAETSKKDNPNLPVTPEEIAESTYNSYLKGASICHLHVRDKDGRATMDINIFQKAVELIRKKCDIVIEVTTGGGVGMSPEERLEVVSLKPEMASLDCGTVNFGNEYIVNTLPIMRQFAKEMKRQNVKPTLECFDLSHVYSANLLVKEGLIEPPYHYSFVLNVPGAAKYDVETLGFFVRRLPESTCWTVIGIGGKAALEAHYGALALGGFMRVGFEDNIYFDKGILAESNAQLVERAAKISKAAGYSVATPADVREMFKLKN